MSVICIVSGTWHNGIWYLPSLPSLVSSTIFKERQAQIFCTELYLVFLVIFLSIVCVYLAMETGERYTCITLVDSSTTNLVELKPWWYGEWSLCLQHQRVCVLVELPWLEPFLHDYSGLFQMCKVLFSVFLPHVPFLLHECFMLYTLTFTSYLLHQQILDLKNKWGLEKGCW